MTDQTLQVAVPREGDDPEVHDYPAGFVVLLDTRGGLSILHTVRGSGEAAAWYAPGGWLHVRRRDERFQTELDWVRGVLAEYGYSGPLAEAVCPLREMLATAGTTKGALTLQERVDLLTRACQLFTRGFAEGGFYPQLGATMTRTALELMEEAGAEPKYFVPGKRDDDE